MHQEKIAEKEIRIDTKERDTERPESCIGLFNRISRVRCFWTSFVIEKSSNEHCMFLLILVQFCLRGGHFYLFYEFSEWNGMQFTIFEISFPSVSLCFFLFNDDCGDVVIHFCLKCWIHKMRNHKAISMFSMFSSCIYGQRMPLNGLNVRKF